MHRLVVITFVALIFAIAPVSAQETTVRYHERTDGQMTIQVPNRAVSVRSEHEALLTVRSFRGDSLHAWYEELEVASVGPMAEQRPDVSSVLGQPFILRVDARGHIQTLSTPEFPQSLEGITDLRYQFFDFFPARGPGVLAMGMSWGDTLTMGEGGDRPGETTKVSNYEVVSDSVVDGDEVFVVTGHGEVTMWTEGPVMEQPGLSVRVTLSGPESNVYLLRKSDGAMVSRRRVARLVGSMEYFGAPQALVLDVTQTYENEINLVAAPDGGR